MKECIRGKLLQTIDKKMFYSIDVIRRSHHVIVRYTLIVYLTIADFQSNNLGVRI